MNRTAIFIVLLIIVGVGAVVSGLAGEGMYNQFMTIARKIGL